MLTRAEDLTGQEIAGYRLLEILGRGGMGVVFLAQALNDPQNRVAIKVLLPSYLTTPEEFVSMQRRFLREAQAANKLHHDHILPVLDYGVVDDISYIVMPVVIGSTLAQMLATRQEPWPLTEIAGYLNQLASAIDYAHKQGFVHRDIKPSNVLVDEQGCLHLVDFGIVHLFDNGAQSIDQALTSLTVTGNIYGTPAYMAPERFRGEKAEETTDIYALGVLLYQLVTGRVPFKADTPLLVAMKHLNEQPPAPRSLRSDLPEAAEAVILRTIAKQPAERFTTAMAVAEAFDAGIKGQWLTSPPPLPPPSAPLPVLGEVQEAQPQPVPLVPVMGEAFPAHQIRLGPPDAAPGAEASLADAPTQARLPSSAQPQHSRPRRGRMLLVASALVALGVVALLLLPQLHQLTSPGQARPNLTTSPGTVITKPEATASAVSGGGSALPAQATATQAAGVTPSPSQTTPTAVPTPSPSPLPSPTTPPPTATPPPLPTATVPVQSTVVPTVTP